MGCPLIVRSSGLVALTIAMWGQTLIGKEVPRLQLLNARSGTSTSVGQPDCQITALSSDHTSSQNARAPSTRFRFARAVYLIKASEIAASGFQPGGALTSIGWTYATAPGVAGSAPLNIYMENTNDTTNTKSTSWVSAISSMTVVHNATTALPDIAGPFTITFVGGSPFTYTGGGLYVAFDWGEYTGTLSTTTITWCNSSGLPSGLLGASSNTAAPTSLSASDFRPETRLPSSIPNDGAVALLHSYGELPLGLVRPQVIQAFVVNRGTNSLTNLAATLSVTGASTFANTQTIPTLTSCGGQAGTNFAPFIPASLGSSPLSVSLPADDVVANNVLTQPLDVTPLSYSYKIPGSTPGGGTGFDDSTGVIVAKFSVNAPNAVAGVKLEFVAASATRYRVAIYGDAGNGTPSNVVLYADASDRTVAAAGPATITLPSPVAVGAGNFYAGIQQTNTIASEISANTENPVRVGAFFNNAWPLIEWHDFSPFDNFIVNIGVVLQTPAPMPSSAISRKVHGAAGNFDINLPLAGNPGLECRSGGANNDYQVVFTFPTPVTFTTAAVTAGTGSVSGISGNGKTNPTVDLTGVSNAQTIAVTLLHINDGSAIGDVSTRMRVLVGDTNGNGSVNASDISQTKAQSGQQVTASNFREDVNGNGVINASDVALVKSKSGTSLP